MKVKCLICDKELEYDETYEGVDNGGHMLISFSYGSIHDQCKIHGHSHYSTGDGSEKSPMTKLLDCDEIEAFICDECFEKKFDKMNGYSVSTRRIRKKEV